MIVERIIAGKDELFITKEILDEIEDVVGRPKFHAEKEKIHYLMNSIEEIGNIILSKKHIKNVSRDKGDNKYIECAVTANADYIISGDVHLLELEKYGKIKIVTAKNYLEIAKQ